MTYKDILLMLCITIIVIVFAKFIPKSPEVQKFNSCEDTNLKVFVRGHLHSVKDCKGI